MALTLPWRTLRRQMDDTVDGLFADVVELHPYTQGGYGSEPQPDPSRSVLKTTGIKVTPGASITGEGGTSGGFNTQALEGDVWLSIQSNKLGKLTDWRQGDRVYFPVDDEWYEIAWPSPSATERPNLHLVRVQPLPT